MYDTIELVNSVIKFTHHSHPGQSSSVIHVATKEQESDATLSFCKISSETSVPCFLPPFSKYKKMNKRLGDSWQGVVDAIIASKSVKFHAMFPSSLSEVVLEMRFLDAVFDIRDRKDNNSAEKESLLMLFQKALRNYCDDRVLEWLAFQCQLHKYLYEIEPLPRRKARYWGHHKHACGNLFLFKEENTIHQAF